MRILVDADACPVKKEIMNVANKYGLDVHFYVDINHQIEGYGAAVHTVDQGSDSADLAIVNSMKPNDVVITSDYGLSSLVLSKNGYILHPSGKEISNANIDQLLFERHISSKQRKSGLRGPKHKKRTTQDNQHFECQLVQLIKKHKKL